jgi:peptidoglycan lytic transglycosylase
MRFVLLPLIAALSSGYIQAAATTGVCSFYSRSYDGRTTAGGEKFSSKALTAAHRSYPMGTKLKVTNIANDKSVVVTVNDRGPFVKGRELSVTRRAAEELGFVKEGLAKVRIEQVQ